MTHRFLFIEHDFVLRSLGEGTWDITTPLGAVLAIAEEYGFRTLEAVPVRTVEGLHSLLTRGYTTDFLVLGPVQETAAVFLKHLPLSRVSCSSSHARFELI